MTGSAAGPTGRRRTFDVYEGGRRIIAEAASEDVVLAVWAKWHARQPVVASGAIAVPKRLRFEVDGMTVIERDPAASSGKAGQP